MNKNINNTKTGKVLDLSVFRDEPFEIIIPAIKDLEIKKHTISIKKPTQRMVIQLMDLKAHEVNKQDVGAIADLLDKMILTILNSNYAGEVFPEALLDYLTIPMKTSIIKAYAEFVAQIQKDPT